MNTSKTTCRLNSRKRPSLSKALALVAIGVILVDTISVANAQSAPVSSRRMGYTMTNDALYIQGGFDTNFSPQLFSLDLSTSWTTSSPAWTQLKDGQLATHLALASVSSASNGGPKGSLVAIGGMGASAFYSVFDIAAGSWTNLATKAPYPNLEGHSAVSDPNTGLIYIIGGFGTNNTIYNELSVYDPKSKNTVSEQRSPAGQSLIDLGAVWVSSRNSVVTFGGTRATPADSKGLGSGELNEYDPSSKSWKTMSTSGDVPPARLDHCMAASDDGSKIVVFGGTPDGSDYFNTIYILDVKSGKWKQGQSASVSRTRMACAFHSHQFIAWGGSSGTSRTTMLNNLPIVYNLNQDKWTENYDAAEVEKKTSFGAIAGGVIGVFLVCAGIGFFLFKKQQRKKEEKAAYHTDAMAAAAVTASEDDATNIKVLAEDPHAGYNNGYTGYGGYGNGDDYPLNNVGNYHDTNYPSHGAMDGSDHYYQDQYANSPSGASSEKYSNPYSPAATHYYGGAAATPIQSPSVAYVSQNGQNPFVSPEDYYPPASNVQDPYLQALKYQQSPPWPTASYASSPSLGARSPQALPGSTVSGYIPPPS